MPAHQYFNIRDTPRVKKCFKAASILGKTHMSVSIWGEQTLSASSPASWSLSFECMRWVSSLMNGCARVYQKMWGCGHMGQRRVWSLHKSSHSVYRELKHPDCSVTVPRALGKTANQTPLPCVRQRLKKSLDQILLCMGCQHFRTRVSQH